MSEAVRYKDKRAIVTGGLGFIGSNLAIRLVEEGARVTIIDSSVAGCGANPYNIDPVRGQVKVIAYDIAQAREFRDELAAADVIFNLAGEISHVHSMSFPERDLQLNTVAQLQFLMTVKENAPGRRIIYAGTRQIYGVPEYLPVDEAHPIQPIDFNGIHKYAASQYHLMLSRIGLLDAIVLRLTNVYGPRMALNAPCQGFLSTFLRRLALGQPVEVFGDGSQLRDPVYVDDAVEAFLLAGLCPQPAGRVYNVGGPEALSLVEIAGIASRAAGCEAPSFRPFPADRRAIDIGSYATNSALIRQHMGWSPAVRFEDGVTRTLEFYRRELPHYLDPARPDPHCASPEHNGTVHRLIYCAV